MKLKFADHNIIIIFRSCYFLICAIATQPLLGSEAVNDIIVTNVNER